MNCGHSRAWAKFTATCTPRIQASLGTLVPGPTGPSVGAITYCVYGLIVTPGMRLKPELSSHIVCAGLFGLMAELFRKSEPMKPMVSRGRDANAPWANNPR